jgi:hypothetical protein
VFGPETNAGVDVKGFGYLVSILSVFLLAAGSLKNAAQDPFLFACLLAGMATSIAGMILRYLDYRREQREKQA